MAFKVKPTKAMAVVLQKMADGWTLHIVQHSGHDLSNSAFLSPKGKGPGMERVRSDYVGKFREWGWTEMISDPAWAWRGAEYRITQAGRDALAGGTR